MNSTSSNSGFFITFEGGEGSGKSSQIALLKDRLEDAGFKTLVTREPGGTTGGEIVRHVLLSGAAESFGPEMEGVLFSAARADHISQVIKPALDRDMIVLCDRFYDSTRVYQGKTGNVEMSFLLGLEDIVCDSVRPDLTLVLDIDPALGMKRAKARRGEETADRFEKESLEAQEARRNGFLEIANEEPDRVKVINASGSRQVVHNRIWKIVNAELTERDMR